MKVIYSYKNSSEEEQSLVRHSDVPRIGDVVRITNFPDKEENYTVAKVLWSMHKDGNLNPDVEATVFLNKEKDNWLGL